MRAIYPLPFPAHATHSTQPTPPIPPTRLGLNMCVCVSALTAGVTHLTHRWNKTSGVWMSVCVCVGLTPTSDNHPNHPSRPTTVPTRRSICQAISLKAQQVRQRVSQILDVGCWMLDADCWMLSLRPRPGRMPNANLAGSIASFRWHNLRFLIKCD